MLVPSVHVIVIQVVAILVASAPLLAPPAEAASEDAAVRESLARSGEAPVIVVLREGAAVAARGASAAPARAALQRRQEDVLRTLPAGSFAVRRRHTHLNGFAGTVTEAGYRRLLRDSRVARVYPDLVLRPLLVEGRALIRADQAHVAGTTGAGVTVAIIDAGIDYRNGNLGGCFGPACKVRGGFDFDADDADPMEDTFSRHGTEVAGIVAADGSNAAAPVLGVAPDARLVALRVCRGGLLGASCLLSHVDAALDWILDHPEMEVGVVSMSLGFPKGSDAPVTSTSHNDPTEFPCAGSLTEAAISALSADGVPVVIAAGNDAFSDGILFPACVRSAIAVGAVFDADLGPFERPGVCRDETTAPGQIICFSNSDELVDVVAPANTCRTTSFGVDGVTTTFGGTSSAAPYTAGTAALALEANPSLTAGQLRTVLVASAERAAKDPESGLRFPMIDAVNVSQPPSGSCGDGVLAPSRGEECDDGGTDPGDGCAADCQLEPHTQDREQLRCVDAMNKNLEKVGKAQRKVILACLRGGAGGGLAGTIEDCVLDDPGGRIARAEAKTVTDEIGRCPTPPDFGKSDAATVNTAARQPESDLIHDLFGPILDAGIVAEDVDRDLSRCQLGIAKRLDGCRKAAVKGFNKCASRGIKGDRIRKAPELAACIGSDVGGKIANACDAATGKIGTEIDRRCAGVDLAAAVPGCGTSDRDDLATCLDRLVDCRFCRTIVSADALDRDCDLYDDLLRNGSCS